MTDSLTDAPVSSERLDELASHVRYAAGWSENDRIDACKAILGYKALREQCERQRKALTPREWTKEMNDAWHRNLPDTQAAFAALISAPKSRSTGSDQEQQ